jgi:hypothetical protein
MDKYCPRCKKHIETNSLNCPECGEKLCNVDHLESQEIIIDFPPFEFKIISNGDNPQPNKE